MPCARTCGTCPRSTFDLQPSTLSLSTPLGPDPELHQVADVAEALRCVSEVDAHTKHVEAWRDAEITRINEQAALLLQAPSMPGAPSSTLQLWRAKLVAAIERFIPTHKSEVFAAGKKTARFAAGEVAYKERPAGVVLKEGTKAADVVDRLNQRHQVAEKFAEVLDALGIGHILRVKLELNLQGLQQRYRDKLLKRKDLPAGLTISAAGETVIVKPSPKPDRADVAEG